MAESKVGRYSIRDRIYYGRLSSVVKINWYNVLLKSYPVTSGHRSDKKLLNFVPEYGKWSGKEKGNQGLTINPVSSNITNKIGFVPK